MLSQSTDISELGSISSKRFIITACWETAGNSRFVFSKVFSFSLESCTFRLIHDIISVEAGLCSMGLISPCSVLQAGKETPSGWGERPAERGCLFRFSHALSRCWCVSRLFVCLFWGTAFKLLTFTSSSEFEGDENVSKGGVCEVPSPLCLALSWWKITLVTNAFKKRKGRVLFKVAST